MFDIFVTPPITDSQVLAVHVVDRHTDAVIDDLDPTAFWVDFDVDGLRVGIPGVRDGLGQNGGDVAVEVDSDVVEHVQVYCHSVCISHRPPQICNLPLSTCYPMLRLKAMCDLFFKFG